MATERTNTSRLFATSVVEGKLDIDEKYDKAYMMLMNLTRGLSDKEAHDILNKAIDDPKQHEDICLGLMVAILSDPAQANRAFQDLMMVCRDSLKGVCDALINHIVTERFHRLLENTKKQVVWLVRQLVRAGVAQVEGVVWCLLRQMAGGDVSARNIWLAESLCDMLKENRTWLERYSVIIASTVYSFLRILEDHQAPNFAALRQKEVSLVITLLREKFQDCLVIGRDLVRLLQNVAKIPEIEALWRDLLHNPGCLAPNFPGLSQLMSTRTSRRFFVVRLTPEMERMIHYLCSEVKFGMQKRYQDWFQRQFLNTPESQSLRCDLIRFIIGVIHPSNEVLCSDITPRWAVIGWLLSSCTSATATANCKLALFYDWLFFSGENDNIMNIEPGILVMYHSLKPHPMLTTTLLDFLCRIIPHFQPAMAAQVRTGVVTSLRHILEKRVIPNIEPLFDNPRMDPELRRLVRETFPEFCSNNLSAGEEFHAGAPVPLRSLDLMAEAGLDFNSGVSGANAGPDVELNNHHPSVEEDAMFSDEDEENGSVTPISNNVALTNTRVTSACKPLSNKLSKNNTDPIINHLPSVTTADAVTGSLTYTTSTLSAISQRPLTYSNNKSSSSLLNSTTSSNCNNISSNNNHANFKSNSAQLNSIISVCSGSAVSDDVVEVMAEDGVCINGNVMLLNGGRTNKCSALTDAQSQELNGHLNTFETDMKDFLLDLKLEKDQARRCELLQKICDLIFAEDLDEEEAEHLAGALSLLLASDYNTETSLLPQHISQESLCESLEAPIFVLFENLLSLNEDDHRRQSLLMLVSALQQLRPATGYRLLFYITAAAKTRATDSSDQISFQVYRDLWKASGQKDLSGFIVRDLTVCSEDDPRLLCWLLPHLYNFFPKHTTGNAELVHLVLQRLDAAQLHDLVCLVLQGTLTMFDNSSFTNILDKSLSWESVEQFFLWQLARAHEIPVDCCLSVLHRLRFSSHTDAVSTVHPEALANILMMLRRESPSESLLKHLLQRELRTEDPTVATILQYWVQRYEDKMAKLINDIVNNKPPTSPNKRKRNQGGGKLNSHVTLDQLLSHLNHLRRECDQTKFFNLSTMQDSLQAAQNLCTESQKKKYGDLFALITDSPDEKSGKEDSGNSSASTARNKQSNSKRGRKPKLRKKPESESEEESSEEEDVKKPARKRKKNNTVFASDSD
ncbi:integrator complex subunit 3 [Hyalella azteca]|uniref:SOSS complex subunit A homolog n=1 Tax=Hyalella azteca TaxID=294128 RepID=A0A8B7P1B7_HYAAZ|nr:integrator complex subunit 3 [Hyalella azteca]